MNEIKCNFIKCAAGMGVAGSRYCFLGGDYTKIDCPQFKDEEEFLATQEKSHIILILKKWFS
jgi:hypothetical protein